MNFETGSLRRTLPSSIIIRMATPTTGLVIDMMRNIESAFIGCFDSRSAIPWAWRWTMRPLRATRVTAPAKLFASRWRFTSAFTCWSRSDDRPTSSGFAVAPAPESEPTEAKHTSATSAQRVREERVICDILRRV